MKKDSFLIDADMFSKKGERYLKIFLINCPFNDRSAEAKNEISRFYSLDEIRVFNEEGKIETVKTSELNTDFIQAGFYKLKEKQGKQ